MRKLVCLGLLATLVGCGPPEEIGRVSVGKILSATPAPVAFLDDSKTAIQTEKMSLVIMGMPPVPIGAEGFVVTGRMNLKYFTWTGADRLHPMY